MRSSSTIEGTDAAGPGEEGLEPRTTLTAVVLDRQPLWLTALAAVLGRHGVDTLATATTTGAALREVGLHNPTALALDPWIADDEMTGLELIAAVRERFGEIRIVGIGSVDAPAQIDAAFSAGVDAYVLKVADPDDIARTIRYVCSEPPVRTLGGSLLTVRREARTRPARPG